MDDLDKCMVKNCDNDRDPGSTQHLCRMCYDLITTGDMLKYYANYTGKNWMSDTVSQIAHLKQDKRDLQDEVDALKMDIKEAYILENDDTLSLNDLRTFYHENKDLRATATKQCNDLVNKIFEVDRLKDENEILKKDINYKKEVIDSIEEIARNKENRENLPLIHENQAFKKENDFLKEEMSALVYGLRKEITALNYNMDHAYNLGDGKFLTLDDLHDFYEDNKKIHNVVEQQRNRIVLLELELKQLQKPKDETFATKTKEYFEKRVEAVAENVKFDTYTEGFRKGFDMGYEKAKDQYYE